MDNGVRTATGKEFGIRFMGSSYNGINYVLYIELLDKTIAESVPIFSNQTETIILQHIRQDEIVKEFRGFVNLTEAIYYPDTNNTKIALATPEEQAF